MRFFLFVAAAIGCGGTNTPDMGVDAATLMDLAGPHDLAGACTPPTSGFYVLSGASTLTMISPDPNSYDGGGYVELVDINDKDVAVRFMTVLGDDDTLFIYGAPGGMYQGSLSAIQNGKLTLSNNGFIKGGAGGVIAPNGGKGDLILEYANGASAVIGELVSGGGTSMVMQGPASVEIPATCELVDFEGSVAGDNYSLTGICRSEIDHIENGVVTTLAPGSTVLVGMQAYKGTIYAMDKLGGLYDSNLKLIKKARNCQANGVPTNIFINVLGL